MELLISIFLPFLLSLISVVFAAKMASRTWLLALGPLALTIFYLLVGRGIVETSIPIEAYSVQWSWIPSLGLPFSLYIDGLSLLFLLLISSIGTLVTFYSSGYMKSHPRQSQFFAFLFFFMGAMLGLVATGNLLITYIFWELTGVASFLLIGFERGRVKARASATQALLVTSAGGLALLGGILLLRIIGGSFEVVELMARAKEIQSHELYVPTLILIFIGAFTKSAIMPFHFWLPNAMSAPTPVSAYLHSATMVKAGVFLIARLFPILGGTDLWIYTLVGFGCVTALLGPMFALGQTDLKKLLAYSTIGSLGMIVILLGIGTETALNAAIVYLFVHSLYKGSLFMIAGSLDHQTGTRDILGLQGLFRVMPITAIAAALSAFSMAGFPPLFGFIGKELIYEAKLETVGIGSIVFGVSVLSNMMTVAVAFIVGLEPFIGRTVIAPKKAHEAPVRLWFGPVALALISLLIGIEPKLIGEPLLSAAARATLGFDTYLSLELWHGFNAVAYFSILTALGGVFLFVWRNQLRRVLQWLAAAGLFGAEWAYHVVLETILELGAWITDRFQNGSLRRYVHLFVATLILSVLLVLVLSDTLESPTLPLLLRSLDLPLFQIEDLSSGFIVFAGCLAAAFSRSRILSVAGVGLIGFGVAVFYASHNAPDVALTQVLVETLSVALTVFLITWLPKQKHDTRKNLPVRAAFAIVLGVVMSLIALSTTLVSERPIPTAEYYMAHALSEGKGRNIVNVILVDFRALDTLGEITVVIAAAIGIYALLSQIIVSHLGDRRSG